MTGAPGAGKTTLVRALAAQGLSVQNEIARELIDRDISGGASLGKIRADERAFHERVIRKKLERDLALPTDRRIVFDRGIPDSVAFGRCYGWDVPGELEAIDSGRLYAGALILERLPIVPDYAHLSGEDEAFRMTFDELVERVYLEHSVPVYRIPVDTPPRRMQEAVGIILRPDSYR